MNIKQRIEKDLAKAFVALGFAASAATVSVSTIDICDYQCNAAFGLAKELKLNPLDLAKEIAGKFVSDVASCEAVPPAFLNFKVKDCVLLQEVQKIFKSGKLPLASVPKRTVFFDYGGANIAKELHVGHLRSPIVGEALKRVYEALGHKTIADVYLGDWGLQNGLILAELELRGIIKDGAFISPVSLDLLNEVYPAASKKVGEAKFKARADEITLLMQQKKAPWFDLWKQMREVSVAKIRENYDRLGCTFDFYNGESDAQPYVEPVLDILRKKGLAHDNDNCLIMDVAKDCDTGPMPPIILQKYNGGDLYATNDVATIFYRARDFKPDEIIYLTDVRQSLHFEQVFRCARGGGLLPSATALTHIGYGTMNGKDGKPFKTRAGGTIKFEDVVNMVTEAAERRLAENGKAGTPDIAERVGIAALKFADLSNNVRKDYVFDLEKFTSFEGKTGPYILYTIARINSLFAKSKGEKRGDVVICNVTRSIIIKTIKLADAYSAAVVNYTLNGIVDAAYTLAAEFNLFYAGTRILSEPNEVKRQGYLTLCEVVKNALTIAMNTLAIEVVDEM
jgi:arginyl-tRNA synthetase